MNKYTFTVFQNHLISIEAPDEDEAYKLVHDKMEGLDDWEVLSVEAECTNCGSAPEEVTTEIDTWTICPKGCFIAF